MKKLLGLIIVAGLIGAGYYYNTQLVNVDKKGIFHGNVDIETTDVSFRISGKIAKMNYKEGDKISKGAVLAEIDSDIIDENIRTLQAAIKVSKANVSLTENEYNRIRVLYKKKVATKREFDNAYFSYKKAEADLDVQTSKLKQEEIAKSDAKLKSYFDGFILSKVYKMGEVVNKGMPIYRVAIDENKKVRIYLPESELGNVKIGDMVTISQDSNDKKFKGKVTYISSVAEFTPKSVETEKLRVDLVYKAKITLEEKSDILKQGMPVTVRFEQK